ncbi:hypothetical protein [Sphingomonas alba]|uniref:Uncharacterized protein n=1 Tax=Sphingomonas alba TaxID=2908208 RepID=A0ABT0RJG8_9SPHN|nr:hypothetical protein [Sphingomonas alba]MCL6682723.1 hypothetical protein [Sphingomonas alba]
MTMFKTMMAGGLGLAALAAAAPASAQYGYYNGYNGYQQPYGNAYGYYGNRANMTQVAANQCAAAVQARLNNRVGVQGILGAVLGANTRGQVISISSTQPSSNRIRVRGLASSGRYAYNNGYGAYGYGAYGATGYGYANAADLSFRCDVDYSGRVRDIDINRRR